MEEVFPVGNTHLAYYEDVLDYFEDRGFSGDGHVLVVGGELIAWHVKDRYPEAFVESIDVEERTLEMQSNVGERIAKGANSNWLMEEVRTDKLLDFGEERGTIYPEIIEELDGRVERPDSSQRMDFADYSGDPDLILSNNVCDYMADFMSSVQDADPNFLEMYTVFPAESVITDYSGPMVPEVNPDVDFWWAPYTGQENVVLYSRPD